ncbi:MAG TPA: 1,4-alpha-glucan branching protein GlgB [Candidatus Fermentibacter daniensis]|jgi:1,4-alpha-glucan branching enzyme|nr:MAG: hypothetical protein AO395_06400 [Candidatus Fermentibacter daniensis]MBP7720371.1 1,4-alpha-glucan branching protein GlgB [Candidatus Fermentibacter sp.]KZD18074.1 MAG: hypothetical protein AO396_02275 [Candidatus Fermentibacter daniensis]KZD18150.1 MAG: hypothetical protein AO394_03855 [Candidatus Fermentibacter daniensis]MCC6871398.1 1,4-alpha-glucan branching protein GlgB [Candidatus Fermentibacter sp.]
MQPETVLTASEIRSIVQATPADPFALLGMHPLGGPSGRLEIRTFCPAATRAWIARTDTSPDTSPAGSPMTRVHGDGLFVWSSPGPEQPFAYLLVFEKEDGSTWATEDPYCFLPQLGELDLHLFNEGRHERMHQVFGGRPWKAGEVEGVLFSVWAPNAGQVSVTGDFNAWDRRRHPMRPRGASGVWELFVPRLREGDLYKFAILGCDGVVREKADPVASRFEIRPATASVVSSASGFEWTDGEWMTRRAAAGRFSSPVSIYEVHAGSWRRPDDGRPFLGWMELADALLPYVSDMGFTHIELLPVMEHPFDGSWGYQTLGYFAPTSRLGSPEDFARFVDRAHAAGIGIILDWTPAHFPSDAHGLARFDGTALYEHDDPRLGRHPDWGTLIFNYGRNEVRGFLISAAISWFDRFHIDALRVDAVASMLYLDYSRGRDAWIPNRYGGRENLDAVAFIRMLNDRVHSLFPGAFTIAEESTAWPSVTRPPDGGGLGFSFKWNMGWMHDTLGFFALDPVHRKYHVNNLTFSQLYAYSENFILPLSHDEVVHGKSSLLEKMPGDDWRRFANLRLLLCYQWAHPGKKLLFMGGEFGQRSEWNHDSQLDWHLLEYAPHRGIRSLVRDLNSLLSREPAMHELDHDPAGFRWIDFSDTDSTVVSFARRDSGGGCVICVFNFTPEPRHGYRIGVPEGGFYRELLNSDASSYGGSGTGNLGGTASDPQPRNGMAHSVSLSLPPLAALFLKRDAPEHGA